MEEEIKLVTKSIWKGGLKATSIIREFNVETDEPRRYFGTNTAPAPIEVFVSCLGSCILSVFIPYLIDYDISLRDCIADVIAYTDKKRIIRAEITISVIAGKENEDKIRECFEIAKKDCPSTNAVSFSVNIILVIKGDLKKTESASISEN